MSPAEWHLTGQAGDHGGVNHVEFELLDTDGERVSLADDNTVSITKNGAVLTPDDQETLWFSVNNPSGRYRFYVKVRSGKLYEAVLNWK